MIQKLCRVSVIVPVYNVEKYINKCLNSLINQTLKDIEIIVVNDGTKDNSQEIIDNYVKKYPKLIKSYIKENGGLSSARNYGLKHAKGQYIAFVDSDDWIESTMLEEMYNCAINNTSDIVVCDTMVTYDNNMVSLSSNTHYSDENIKNYIISYPMACIRLIKCELFNKVEFKENTYYEDLQLMPQLAIYTSKISFLEKPLYFYYQHENSIMNRDNHFNVKLLDIFNVLNDVENSYKRNNLYKKYYEEIEYLYITHLLRSASLRFLNYKNNIEYLNQINLVFKTKYSNWNHNSYYKKSSIKLKLICFMSYHRKYKLLRILKKLGGK